MHSLRLITLSLLATACAHTPASRTPEVRALMERHARPGGVNHQHMLRLARLVPRFAQAEGARPELVEAAALLHDATKEDGDGAPFERFCTHGEQAARLARRELPPLGFSAADVERVATAIEQHMGPLGDNPTWGRPRFMSGFCRRPYPPPSSPEARVLFDLDMLDLMTVDGVVKVVTLRQRNPEFAKESLEASAQSGADSALKSVVDAQQVLLTATGRACGADVEAHTRAFLAAVDFVQITTVEAFFDEARNFLSARPLPACVTP